VFDDVFDDVFAFLKVVSSAVSDATRAVLLGSEGLGGEDIGQEMFSALGMIGRPKPPEGEAHTESIAARRGDGYAHIAYRDRRLQEKFPNPKEGEFAWVHYGGGFHSMTETPEGTTLQTFYVPYALDSQGVPQKAHVITIDPTAGNESISVLHADGHGVMLNAAGSAIVKNKAGDAYLEVGDSGVVVNGNTVINGGATIGDPVGALPAAIAPSVTTYLSALEQVLITLATALDAKLAASPGVNLGVVNTFVAAQAATKTAMAATKTSVK